MNIVFLSLVRISSLDDRGIYTDLLRCFLKNGHSVTIVCPLERRYWLQSSFNDNKEALTIFQIPTLNLQKTNILEKAIGTLLIEPLFNRAVKKYNIGSRADLLMYSTPPVTFASVIKKVKKNNLKVKTYLLLKDIFPQNAVDINLFSKSSLIYKYFRRKECTLYKVSDYIGCMSQANVKYILENNKFLDNNRVEVCPNSIELIESPSLNVNKVALRKKYSIPENVTVFLYGGNLGKPQGITFIERVIEAFEEIKDVFLLIVGSGTEFLRLSQLIEKKNLKKTLIKASLPKEQYDSIVRIADVGLIFLDHRFTIPNFPSRLLSYLENSLPVISATDSSTDIGAISESAKFGVSCRSNNINDFIEKVMFLRDKPEERLRMGKNGYTYLKENYTVDESYRIIMKHFS